MKAVIEFAVGETRPDLTLFLHVPAEVSAERLRSRQIHALPFVRDRIEEADRKFFERVAHGFGVIAAAEPQRVKFINGAQPVEVVCADNLGNRPAGFAESWTVVERACRIFRNG